MIKTVTPKILHYKLREIIFQSSTSLSNNSKACNLLTRLATWFTVVIAKLIVPDVYTAREVLEGGLRVGSSGMIYKIEFQAGLVTLPNLLVIEKGWTFIIIPRILKKKKI